MLFIIWGWRGRNKTVGQGVFHCPSCGCREQYSHVQVRRFFTLYFIPLIPLDLVGEYIECSACDGTFKPEVLSFDSEQAEREFRAEFETAVKRTLVHMMMVDGRVDPSEVDAIRHIHRGICGRDIQPDEIRSEVVAATHGRSRVQDYLASVSPHLNNHGKEMVIRAACMVATADGVLHDKEREFLLEIARILGVSESHFRGILMSLQGVP